MLTTISKALQRTGNRTFSTRTIPSWKINVKGQSGSISSMSFGVGTFHDDLATNSVLDAFKSGMTFIDNGMMQGNQEEVGVALKRSGLKRDQF